MRVLLVGAGAVGQVYGRHLQQAGVQISYYVKDKYAMGLRTGLTVYDLNRNEPWEPLPFYGYETLTELSEVRAHGWDQIWFCVSSTALRGEWLDDFLDAVGDAAIVSLQPGLKDQEVLLNKVGKERLVTGLIGFIAYQAPLAHEPVERVGIAYYFPPFVPSLFSGPASEVKPIIKALKMSRLPCRSTKKVGPRMAQASSVLMPLIVGLQASGWSFERFRTGKMLDLAARAAREAQVIVSSYHQVRPSFARHLIRSFVLGIVIRLAPYVMPFPLEIYLRVHFTKVDDQSRSLLDSYRKEASQKNHASQALNELFEEVYTESP